MRGFAATLGVLCVALVAAAGAQAQPPSLIAVSVTGGQTRAVWSLPTNVRSNFVEIANGSDVNQFGYFLQRNIVSFDVLRESQRSFTDDLKLLPGTYYLHIAGHDNACATCPSVEFSHIMRYTVTSAGTATGVDAGPTPTKSSDKKAPRPTVRYRRRQDIDRLSVRARMNERGTVATSATVTVPGAAAAKRFRFKNATRSVKAGENVSLRLRLAKPALRTVKRALRRGMRLRARVRISAVDISGNSRSKTVFIRLRP